MLNISYRTILLTIIWLFLIGPVLATPEFARRYQVNCNTCHTVAPKLNERGMDFWARGYRPDPSLNMEEVDTVALSVWLSQYQDRRLTKDINNNYFGKVELIAGGTIGDDWNYFIEWRPLSLETRSDGTLRDRSGRFEDLQFTKKIDDRWSMTIGQYRPLFQVDAGRKLSQSTNVLYDLSLAGDKSKNSRISSLRDFSTNGRSPGISFSYQSIQGELSSDGLFHQITLPFPGEFSIPLTTLAQTEASFAFEPTPKGVVMETYYRKGLNSIGAHTFIDHNRWLATMVGEYHLDDLYLTAGIGFDDRTDDHSPMRVRSSLEIEYLPSMFDDEYRPGVGFRIENVSHSGKPVILVPYIVLGSPNFEEFSSLLQLEYRVERGAERLRLDYSLFF